MQMMQDLQTPAPPPRPVMPTLQQYLEETFLPFLDKCTSLKPKSILSYRNGCRLLKNTTLTGADDTERPYTLTPLDQVCFSDVDTLKIPGGPSSTNNMRRTLSRMLSHAVDKRIIAAKPRIHLAKECKRTAVYSPEIEQKVLAMAEQPLLDLFLLVFDGGVRPDESLHLRWSDMLWDKSLIHIEAGKTSRAERYVPMSERVREMLIVRARGTTSEWILPSPRKKGAPWTYGPIGQALRGAAQGCRYSRRPRALQRTPHLRH